MQSKTHPFVVVKPENCNIESLRLPFRHANVKKTWKTVRKCNMINKSRREKRPLPEEEEKWSKRGDSMISWSTSRKVITSCCSKSIVLSDDGLAEALGIKELLH